MGVLTDKITFLMTNKKIRNLLIIVIVAFSLVGALKYLDLYEGMSAPVIIPEQTSEKSLMEEIDKTTKDTNAKVMNLDEKIGKISGDNKLIIEKEKI
jgi:hypothetical protein